MADNGAKHKTKRPASLASVIFYIVIAVLAVVGGFDLGTGRWQLQPVLTGSMRPGLPVGSIVVLKRVPIGAVQVRDVILVSPPGYGGQQFVHRVVELQPEPGGPVIRTQGDANAVPDPWRVKVTSRFVYEATMAVPYVGYLALAVHSANGRRITLAAAVALLLVAAALSAHRRRRSRVPDGGVPGAGVPGAGEAPASLDEEPGAHLASVGVASAGQPLALTGDSTQPGPASEEA